MTESLDDRLAALLRSALRLTGPVPADETRLDSLPAMDSLKFMELVAALEAETGEIDLERLAAVETVGDVRRLLAGA